MPTDNTQFYTFFLKLSNTSFSKIPSAKANIRLEKPVIKKAKNQFEIYFWKPKPIKVIKNKKHKILIINDLLILKSNTFALVHINETATNTCVMTADQAAPCALNAEINT